MSAFEDYCIVCDKICQNNSAYCSDGCKEKDQQQSASFTLSTVPPVQYQHTHTHAHTHSHPQSARNSVSHNNVNSAIPTIISPLLTPQVFPRSFQNGGTGTPMANMASIKSPQLKDLTYESPLLNSSTSALNDLDSNRLDLNASCTPFKNAKTVPNSNSNPNHMMARNASSSISERLSLSSLSSNENDLNLNTKLFARNDNQSNITDVSNVLSTCASENYKKWLSIH